MKLKMLYLRFCQCDSKILFPPLSAELVCNEPGASDTTGLGDGVARWGKDGEVVAGLPEELHLG